MRRLLVAAALAALIVPVLRAEGLSSKEDILSRKFVDAANTGDDALRRTLIAEIYAPSTIESVGMDRIAGQVASLLERFGRLELHHGEVFTFRSGDIVRRTLHVFARGRNEKKWFDFQFHTADGDPLRLTQLIFVAEVTEPVALPNGEIESRIVLDWLNEYVDQLAADDEFSGSILIALGDEIIFDRTVGFADAAGKIRNDSATRFGMASGGKMFTAVAVAKLVEMGKLDWTTPLLDAVDGFPRSPRAERVTLHHLLTHTSGVGEYWTDEYEKHWDDLKSPGDTLPFVIEAGFDSDPGSEFRYSNSNFILLGLAIEKATGMSYYDYVQNAIFDPLEMKSTGYPIRTTESEHLASPLVQRDGRWVVARSVARGTSAGGSVATTHDVLRFARGLVAGRLVSPETLKMMTTSKTTGMAEALEYGYGFIIETYPGGWSFGHGGIANGTDFDLQIFPDRDLTFVIFGNRGAAAFDTLKRNTRRLITGER